MPQANVTTWETLLSLLINVHCFSEVDVRHRPLRSALRCAMQWPC
jgi:hypothetical protein